ncbi:MAG: hypothetical protein F6K10_33835 [Moorea sp. SIO2B7]|nr:hypothetical protein [Moorena sp. SIO2B7]
MGIMGKRLTIAEHLREEEIEQHYRGSTLEVERSQWQIIWLLKKGKKSEEVAEVTGTERAMDKRNSQTLQLWRSRSHLNEVATKILEPNLCSMRYNSLN